MSSSEPSQAPVKISPKDGRSEEQRALRRTRESLRAHLGGSPTQVQAALIDQIAWLTLFVDRMNNEALESGGVHSGLGARRYLAYQNSLTRALARLGLQKVPAPRKTVAQILAEGPLADDPPAPPGRAAPTAARAANPVLAILAQDRRA